jgi:predicted Fe-S protein YdhL (DUF1289 family)
MTEISSNTEDRSTRPPSPCVLICTLDDDQSCLGCGRTLAEISSWAWMTVAEQWALIDELVARSPLNDATIPAENGD